MLLLMIKFTGEACIRLIHLCEVATWAKAKREKIGNDIGKGLITQKL